VLDLRRNDATTDEHNFRRSDLIEHVGRPTPVQPLFYHDATGRKNVRLCGPDNPHLLHRKMLCAPCNNVLTQPHDLAWEKLSGFLAGQHDATRFIAMRQVFGKRVQAELENLHLFFVKKLGCAIVRARDELADPVLINLAPLAKAIRMGTPAPNVFLRLVCDAGEWNGGDNANAVLIENDIAWFEFCYLVGGRGYKLFSTTAWHGAECASAGIHATARRRCVWWHTIRSSGSEPICAPSGRCLFPHVGRACDEARIGWCTAS
jgi:hypothetical protein